MYLFYASWFRIDPHNLKRARSEPHSAELSAAVAAWTSLSWKTPYRKRTHR